MSRGCVIFIIPWYDSFDLDHIDRIMHVEKKGTEQCISSLTSEMLEPIPGSPVSVQFFIDQQVSKYKLIAYCTTDREINIVTYADFHTLIKPSVFTLKGEAVYQSM